MRQTINAADVAVPPVTALTSGLAENGTVYITGQLAFDPASRGISEGCGAAAQTEIIMARIVSLLRSEGLTTDDLVKVTIFITDIADLMAVNEVYTRHVRDPFPARSNIGVAFLALPGAKVEIECTARRDL